MSSVDSKQGSRGSSRAGAGTGADGAARTENVASVTGEEDVRLSALFDQASSSLHRAVTLLEPDRLSGPDAQKLYASVVEVLRLATAAKFSLATRIESSNIWRDAGHRTAAGLIAETEGVGVGQAQSTLETGKALCEAPGTSEALRDGKLSEPQVKELASAVAVDPDHEDELVDAAQGEPLSQLRDRCKKTRARAASADPAKTMAAIHKGRHLRHWTDEEGALCLRGRFTPDRGAQLVSVLEAATKDRFEQARRDGDREPMDAYAADALVGLVCGDSSLRGRPKTVMNVRVDQEALFNREARGDEVSAIDGIGDVPVPVVQSLLSDSFLKVLFYKGKDVTVISHPGRYINAPIRTALANDHPTCAVPGCGSTKFLETDHIQPVNENGPVELSNLVRLCSWHHDKKTHEGYVVYKDDNGDWHFDPPPPIGKDPGLGSEPGGLYDSHLDDDDEQIDGARVGKRRGTGKRGGTGKLRGTGKRGRDDNQRMTGPRAGPPRARSSKDAEPGGSPPLFDL
jgi:hypothetical protein